MKQYEARDDAYARYLAASTVEMPVEFDARRRFEHAMNLAFNAGFPARKMAQYTGRVTEDQL